MPWRWTDGLRSEVVVLSHWLLVDLMALSLVLCKKNRTELKRTPASPRYVVARGRLSRREYWSQEATLKVFITATSIFPCTLIGHYPTKYKLYLVHCSGRQEAQLMTVLISFGQI